VKKPFLLPIEANKDSHCWICKVGYWIAGININKLRKTETIKQRDDEGRGKMMKEEAE
jgi:hypothetical protein